MRTLKVAIPSAVLAVGFLICSSTASYAKPEYSKKTGKSCVTCHVKAGAKDLNDTGKCYKENNHSLDNCKVAEKK